MTKITGHAGVMDRLGHGAPAPAPQLGPLGNSPFNPVHLAVGQFGAVSCETLRLECLKIASAGRTHASSPEALIAEAKKLYEWITAGGADGERDEL